MVLKANIIKKMNNKRKKKTIKTWNKAKNHKKIHKKLSSQSKKKCKKRNYSVLETDIEPQKQNNKIKKLVEIRIKVKLRHSKN